MDRLVERSSGFGVGQQASGSWSLESLNMRSAVRGLEFAVSHCHRLRCFLACCVPGDEDIGFRFFVRTRVSTVVDWITIHDQLNVERPGTIFDVGLKVAMKHIGTRGDRPLEGEDWSIDRSFRFR